MKETEQDIGTLSQARKAFVQTFANFRLGVKNGIFHTLFDIAMTILFWVEFWRIGWKILDMNFRVFRQVSLHQKRFVGSRLIPNQDERPMDVSSKML